MLSSDQEEQQAAEDQADEIISQEILEGCTSGCGVCGNGYRYSFTLTKEVWKD